MPLSDADDNGASFEHAIGDVDAAGAAIGAVNLSDSGRHCVVMR
jgi:hypothetical protein